LRGSSKPPERLNGLQRTHRLLIAAALVAGLWGLRTGLPLGVGLHFLGAACLYLLFGAPRALLGLALAAALAALLGGTPISGLPWAWLANGALPVAVVWGVHRAVARFAPANPFCYVFCIAFAGAGFSMIASLALHELAGAAVEPFVALGLMMSFGEAFLTGMLVTILVVYRRDWVVTFDDARWLAPRA
jgi:uncharacterized membrane protein